MKKVKRGWRLAKAFFAEPSLSLSLHIKNANRHPTILYCLILANILSSTSSPKSSFFCLIGRYAGCKPTYGSLIGNNIREVRNWSVGEFPDQFLSSHAILQEQSSQDRSRRMLFPLKTDNFIRCKKKKKEERMCVCVCVCVKI